MPQRMHGSALVDAAFFQRRLENNLHAGDRQRLGRLVHVRAAATWSGSKIPSIGVEDPEYRGNSQVLLRCVLELVAIRLM